MPGTRPASPLPDWATDTNYTTGPDVGQPTKVQPLSGEVAQGYFRGGRPPAEKFNWWQNKVGQWINWGSQFWIDGENGGFWAPTTPIIIYGAGLFLNGKFEMGGPGAFQIDSGVPVAEFGCPVVIDSAAIPAFQVVNGSQFFGPLEAFDGINVNEIALTATGAAWGASSTLLGNNTGVVDFQIPVTIDDELILSGAGRIRERIVYAPNADHTFTPTDATVIVAKSGLTAHTWTFQDGTFEGQTIRLVNYSSGIMTLHNGSAGALIFPNPSQLPAAPSGNHPSVMTLMWVDPGTGPSWNEA